MRRPRSHYKDVSEAAWQDQVIDALHYCGWRVAHFRTAMTRAGNWVTPVAGDGKGFPDLVCLHPKSGDRLVAELKTEYAQATPEQIQWLTWWEACGVDSYLWRPSMVDAVLDRVRTHPLTENENALTSPLTSETEDGGS